MIKRYADRKLYDTVAGGFTSLARIRTLVRDGIEVVVVDHSTGADRTAEILSRTLSRRRRAGVIIEYDQPDIALLAELIRTPHRVADVTNPDDVAAIKELRAEVQALGETLDQLIADAQPRGDAASPRGTAHSPTTERAHDTRIPRGGQARDHAPPDTPRPATTEQPELRVCTAVQN